MDLEKTQALQFNYSDIFFSYLLNDESHCAKMAKNHVLMYVYSGEFLVEEGLKKTIISKGECVFIRKNHKVIMIKRPADSVPYKGIFMILKREFLHDFYNHLDRRNIPEEQQKKLPSIIRINKNVNMDSLFASMLPYFDVNIVPQENLMNLKQQEAVYSLLSIDKLFYQILFDFTNPWKIDLRNFMECNYMYDLSMEEFASFTGRSLSTFKRDFKRIYDQSPQKWLIERRLQTAYQMIKEEGKRVKDVYLDVGFKNQSHFSQAFKKKFGIYPTE